MTKLTTIADFQKLFEGKSPDMPVVADTNEGEVFMKITGVSMLKADPEGYNNEEGVPTPEMICVDVEPSSLLRDFMNMKSDTHTIGKS